MNLVGAWKHSVAWLSDCSVQSKTVPCTMRINTNTISLDVLNLSGWGSQKFLITHFNTIVWTVHDWP